MNSYLIFAKTHYSNHGGASKNNSMCSIFYINIHNSHSNILLRCSKEIKALITARHGESIRFNLLRWT